jgi:Fe2+ or Zn2+ uptake regulation protein
VQRARLRHGVAHDHPHAADHTHALPAGDAVLRTRGRRLTRQRRMIWEVLAAEPDRHLSAQEVCERCGAVRHVHDEVLGDLGARVEAHSGYALAGRELTLFGTCPDCRGAR